MIGNKTMKWLPKFVKLENELNALLREAAQDGVKPFIRIHEDEMLMGKNVQSVEISLVLGKVIHDYIDGDTENGERELRTGEFFVFDGFSKTYTIYEYTEYHYEAENVRAEEGILGLKRYETSDGLRVNRLDENNFIVFDGLEEIRVNIKFQILDDRLT